jgi:hypothetical protein
MEWMDEQDVGWRNGYGADEDLYLEVGQMWLIFAQFVPTLLKLSMINMDQMIL